MAGATKYEEWYFQSDYDLETAIYMLKSGRNIYCVFMCHLSVEKALKGLFIKLKQKFPTKTHDLLYFVNNLKLKLNESDLAFVYTLNELSVPTRYSEDLRRDIKFYSKERTEEILNKTKIVQAWIKQQ